MSFLLGAFGAHCASKYSKKLLSISESIDQTTLQKIFFVNGIVFAGQNKNTEFQHNKIIPLVENSGIIVGKIFNKASNAQVKLDINQVRKIIENPARLTKEFWGNYIAVLHDKVNKTFTLVRDPLGLSTLFYMKVLDGILFSTDIKLIYDALENKPVLDMNFFAEHIININQALPATPLQNVKELQPGMSLAIKSDGSFTYRYLWDIESIKSK
jgi:hypothetical protein